MTPILITPSSPSHYVLDPPPPTGIFGALYCLADVHTEFSEVAKQLKEVAELLGQGLNRQLGGPLLHEYLVRCRGWVTGVLEGLGLGLGLAARFQR